MEVVVAGVNARNIVRSAKLCNFRVHAVAKYCDEDLKLYSTNFRAFEEVDEGINAVVELCENFSCAAVLSTGFEKFAKKLRRKVEVLGSFDERCLDKLKFYRALENAGISYPELLSESDDGIKIAKPRYGGGGTGVFLTSSLQDLPGLPCSEKCKRYRCERQNYILQKFVDGETFSVIVAGDGENAKALAVNRLISGWKEMNAEGFLYSGNVTPCSGEFVKELRAIAEEVASLFSVEGCAGVDFVVADKPYVLELNPRIPGSLDSFELSYDESLFKIHVEAVNGRIDFEVKPKRSACRAIYYAPEDVEAFITPSSPFFADIPGWGERFEKGKPVVSIVATGSNPIQKVVERKRLLETFCLKFV